MKRSAARRAAERGAGECDWAFHASNAEVFDALAAGRHSESLREYFGTQAFAELSVLAAAANRPKRREGAPILIIPGMMGSRLCDIKSRAPSRERARARVLWIDPLRIAAGHLEELVLPSVNSIRPRGVLLAPYAKLKLQLAIEGFAATFFAYDWRLGIDALGAALAAKIAAGGKSVVLIAHSMGGLVARVAVKQLPKSAVRRLIMLGVPNRGAFAPVLALRGTYPFVRKLSRLDLENSPDYLAAKIFCTFPGLYHMLPAERAHGEIDLLDPGCWPSTGPQPDARLLARVPEVRSRMAKPDARMVQIVGVNRETVVAVRRTAAAFEYGSNSNGDGTVPVAMSRLPALKSYFVEESHGNLASNPRIIAAIMDLVRDGSTSGLAQRFTPRKDGMSHVDDDQLRTTDAGKVDWRLLDTRQREAALADLEGGQEEAL